MCEESINLFEELQVYRAWLVSVSNFFRKNLRRVVKAPLVEFGVEAETFYSVLGGQRSSREGALPSRCGSGSLSTLDRSDVSELIVNLQGRQKLISMLSFRVDIASPVGVRNGYWRKKWVPLAEAKDDVGGTILFVDNDPEPGYPAGRLVEERAEIGWNNGKIVRSVVGDSLIGYIECILSDISRGFVKYKEGIGVIADKEPN
jgi:hypothetical protein